MDILGDCRLQTEDDFQPKLLSPLTSHLSPLTTKKHPLTANLKQEISPKSFNFIWVMKESVFEITQMDCPSEENLIRMKLADIQGIGQLDFDIPNRTLTVYHQGPVDRIEEAIRALDLGGRRLSTQPSGRTQFDDNKQQRNVLWSVLGINFAFFVIEMSTGLISRSMGLVADSLDMLADSFVYGLSLIAVGGSITRKKRVAKLAGYFQISLAVIGFIEVLRRFFGAGQLPDFTTMIVVSILALIANAICLYLLQRSKGREEAHMKASMIFTSNDIIINAGVITAGLLVNWLHSGAPDLIIGTIVFALVIRGALRILKLGD
jgi:cation transport ATPase